MKKKIAILAFVCLLLIFTMNVSSAYELMGDKWETKKVQVNYSSF